jgi:hypothetical protein
MQLMQLGAFFAAMILLVVCGCIFTRRPTKSLPSAAEHGKAEATETAEPPLGVWRHAPGRIGALC